MALASRPLASRPLASNEVAGGSTVSGSVSFAGSGAFNPTGTELANGSVSFAGVGALNAAGTETAAGSVAFAGVGAFNVTGVVSQGASDVQFAGVGSLNLVGATLVSGQVNFGGTGAFSPVLFVVPPVSSGIVPAGSPAGRKHYKKPRRVVIGDKTYLVRSEHELDYIVDKVLSAPEPIKANAPREARTKPIKVQAPSQFVPAPLNPRNVEIAEHHGSQEVRDAIHRIEHEIDEGEVAMLMQTAVDNDRQQDEQIMKLVKVLSGRKDS